MAQPWPPPPDLASIQELVRAADPEGHLADGAAADEYEPEEEQIFTALKGLTTADLEVSRILPLIEPVWQKSFNLSEEELSTRRPALLSLAKEIERFFGPRPGPEPASRSWPTTHEQLFVAGTMVRQPVRWHLGADLRG